jgi:hypothetical protein
MNVWGTANDDVFRELARLTSPVRMAGYVPTHDSRTFTVKEELRPRGFYRGSLETPNADIPTST